MEKKERISLGKTLSRKDIWAFSLGAIVGWGWIMMAGSWVENAGTLGAIIAFVFGAIMAGLVGLVYAELTPMLPLAGGEMVWAYRSGGYRFGWFCGWAICFAYVAVVAWEGPSFATAISYLLPAHKPVVLWSIAGSEVELSWLLISVLGSIGIIFCHYHGMKFTALMNTIAAAVLVAGGILFFGGSVTLGDFHNTVPLFKNGFGGIASVMMVAPAMFIGFDVIPQAAEEMNIPLKQIGYMVLFAVGLGALWYICMILGVGFAVPDGSLDGANVPLADAATAVFGTKLAGYLIIIAGIGGILTSWNAMFIGSTRIIFAMARAGMLPSVFAQKNKKYDSPTAAIFLVGVLNIMAPFLGKNALGWFIDSSSLGSVIAYLCVAISYVILRIREPKLERPLKLKYWKLVALLSIAACLFFISLYMPFGSSALNPLEWILFVGWYGLGILLMRLSRKEAGFLTAEEREHRIFGDEYARKNRRHS